MTINSELAGSLQRLPLRDQVLSILQRAIVTGEIGPGERIRDQSLAEQLEVSRTPVREALQQLEAQGLVETRPGAMTRVTELNVDEAVGLFPVVAALHGVAARMGVPNLVPEDLEKMSAYNQELLDLTSAGRVIEAMEADTRFHAVLVEASGNQIVVSLLEWLTPRVRRYEYASFDMDIGHRSVHDHHDIMAACRAGDVVAAAKLVEANWLILGERIVGGLSLAAGKTASTDGHQSTRKEA